MSNLNPGGSRSNGGRIFGAHNIKRAIQTQKSDHSKTSGRIAGQEHEHNRERERRLRQKARKEAK